MRIESSVTSISWIPSEAVTGLGRMAFDSGFTHYDQPPPDQVDDLEELRRADRFRFANHLRAWIEVDDRGRVLDAGYAGQGLIGDTHVRLGRRGVVFQNSLFPDLQAPPEVEGDSARFVQTVGGRTALPAPRRVNRPPFLQFRAPTVWTTLALTIRSDGSSSHQVVGASPFPRHWVYDHEGRLVAKSGLTHFKDWYRHAFGRHSPWGEEDTPAFVTAAETALERTLSTTIMRGGTKPAVRSLRPGEELVRQGEEGDQLFLLLDGVLQVDVDGQVVAEVGPGAVLGERALLEGGRRTSTLRALTSCRVAVAGAGQLEPSALAELREGHRREETPA